MSDPHKTLSQKADQCVKCGLCLPYCPTFNLSHDENQSPRGRISLIEGLAKGAIKATPSLKNALESCLSCYRCQTVCPAEVDYASLIETARQQWAPSSLGLFRWGQHARFWPLFHFILWLSDFLKLRALAKHSGLLSCFGLSRHEQWLPHSITRPHLFKTVYRHTAKVDKGAVFLFLGCVTRLSMQNTWLKLIPLLNTLGYTVHIPKKQGCCGALFAHSGHPQKAQHCQENNQNAFVKASGPILSFASGCHRDLKNHLTVVDVMDFLSDAISETEWEYKTSTETIWLHTPCTQQNQTGLNTLLKKIPGLSIESLPSQHCCGAAGLQGIQQAEQADALGKRLLEPLLKAQTPTRLLSTNTGCALHLAHLLSKKQILVQHPLDFLMDHLKRKN